jgi:hypothetical protein
LVAAKGCFPTHRIGHQAQIKWAFLLFELLGKQKSGHQRSDQSMEEMPTVNPDRW